MTCIAWDGKTLAADKRGVANGLARTVTKIFRHNDALLAIAGDFCDGMWMVEWYRNGARPEDFPSTLQGDDKRAVQMVVVTPSRLVMYDRSAFPMPFEDRFYATGSGRDYAIAAMHLGKTAREAVEIASLFDPSCGNGIDAMTLRDGVMVNLSAVL